MEPLCFGASVVSATSVNIYGFVFIQNPAAYIIPLSVDAFILQKKKTIQTWSVLLSLSVSFPNGIYE